MHRARFTRAAATPLTGKAMVVQVRLTIPGPLKFHKRRIGHT